MVDDYHLEILRGNDLMGRWYLADVEVKREIAERFTLFLGDDEMEFLADDALVFAYEGVTRMQEGWVNAKKRKRRHRRAAADAARRKDEAPIDQPTAEPIRTKTDEPARPPAPKKAPTSDLAKKLAAIASAEAAASGEAEKRRLTWAEAEALELGAAVQTHDEDQPLAAKKPRKRAAPTNPAPAPAESPVAPKAPKTKTPATEPPRLQPPVPAPIVEVPAAVAPPIVDEIPVGIDASNEPVPEKPKRRRPPRPPVEELAEPDYPEPSWIAPPPLRTVTVDLSVEEPVVIEAPLQKPPAPSDLPDEQVDDDSGDELTKRRQRRKNRRESPVDDHLPEPVEEKDGGEITDIAAARGKVKEPKGAGHHPAETNIGLLAKLRRPPKADQEHVHTYQESRSSGGLTRRVCIECNHVSITSDD